MAFRELQGFSAILDCESTLMDDLWVVHVYYFREIDIRISIRIDVKFMILWFRTPLQDFYCEMQQDLEA